MPRAASTSSHGIDVARERAQRSPGGGPKVEHVAMLVRALCSIDEFCRSSSLREWERVIREARAAKLLGTLEARVRDSGLFDAVPVGAQKHLIAGRHVAYAQGRLMQRELRAVGTALANIGAPVVLLKGAAYLASGLPCARGRIFNDLDILVPESALPRVEAALMLAGFATTHKHPYDQRYYRRWMHELPPMQHVRRGTTIDVHHTIVPRTSRIRLDAGKLFDDAIALQHPFGFNTLSPADMVLHSATHLFNNEDMTQSLRDLVDIDSLLRHFGTTATFWSMLDRRAAELDLWRPLFYALTWSPHLLDTPMPSDIAGSTRLHRPVWLLRPFMQHLLHHALQPGEAAAPTRWARKLLYLRGQWLKMPLPLLVWHLTVKSLRREERLHNGRPTGGEA